MKFLIGVMFSSALFFLYVVWNNYAIEFDAMIICTLSGVILGAVPGMLYSSSDKWED